MTLPYTEVKGHPYSDHAGKVFWAVVIPEHIRRRCDYCIGDRDSHLCGALPDTCAGTGARHVFIHPDQGALDELAARFVTAKLLGES